MNEFSESIHQDVLITPNHSITFPHKMKTLAPGHLVIIISPIRVNQQTPKAINVTKKLKFSSISIEYEISSSQKLLISCLLK